MELGLIFHAEFGIFRRSSARILLPNLSFWPKRLLKGTAGWMWTLGHPDSQLDEVPNILLKLLRHLKWPKMLGTPSYGA